MGVSLFGLAAWSLIFETFRFYAPHLPAGFDLIIRLIRLAHKYQVVRTLEDAMSRLRTLYPDDLDVFIEVLSKRPEHTLFDHRDLDCLEVIQLARLVGDHTLLRPAFYRLCQVPPDDLRGVNDTLRARFGDDIERCLKNRIHLEQATINVRQEMLAHLASGGCAYRYDTICRELMYDMREDLKDDLPTPCGAFICINMEGTLLCKECFDGVKRKEKNAQERVWDEIPRFFEFTEQ